MTAMAWAGAVARDVLRISTPWQGARTHLDATMAWLCRAHDVAGGGGVSRSYSLRYKRAHHRRGWLGAYPETTGYIIPTMLKYADLVGEDELAQRALAMGRWEADVQLPSGAVQAGVIGSARDPAIFNTGQVLFGWAALLRRYKDAGMHTAAVQAGEFLLQAQDEDGAWRRHGSTRSRPGVNVYDARSAWGLLEAGMACEREDFVLAARRNLDFALSRQLDNGWFGECCLDDDEQPLLHTLAYTAEGLLEAGLLLDEENYTKAAKKSALALVSAQREDGSLAGRFDKEWTSRASWSCLTGDAQTGIIWWRLYQRTGNQVFAEAAVRVNKFLASTQALDNADDGVRGGIKGAHPIWGDYGSFEYLNWAAKFFADSLMLQLELEGQSV